MIGDWQVMGFGTRLNLHGGLIAQKKREKNFEDLLFTVYPDGVVHKKGRGVQCVVVRAFSTCIRQACICSCWMGCQNMHNAKK